jgi:protein arginine kinase
MYQISNEVTLGVSEEYILSQVEDVVTKLSRLEEGERQKLKHGSSALEVQDECLRSFGILTNCAKISSGEFVKLSANVKLGACLGYINIDDVSKIDDMVIKLRPSNINADANRILTPLERDVYRAQYATKYLKNMIANKD